MKNEGKKLTIEQSIAWNSVGSTVYLAVQWLLTIFVTRILGYEEAGVFSLAISFSNIFYALAVYGVRNYQVSDLEMVYSPSNYILSRVITVSLAGVLCAAMVTFNHYSSWQVLCILAYFVFRMSEAFFDVLSGIYQCNWRLDISGKSQIIRGLLMLTVFPTTIYLTKHLLAGIALTAVSVYSCLIFYDGIHMRQLEPIHLFEKPEKVKSLLIGCFPLAVYSVLSAGIGSIPRYFLELFCGSEELGIYASVAMPTLIVQIGASYIFTPLVSVFAEACYTGDKKGFRSSLKKCTVVIGCLGIAAMIAAKLIGAWGLKLLYTESILPYTYLLLPLIIATILTALLWFFASVITVIRDFKSLIIGHVIAVVVSILGSMILIPLYGMQGASYALILALILGVAILTIGLLRYLRK